MLLRQHISIEKIQGINFYLTPLHPETGEEALIVDSATDEEIDTIMIDNPTKKATTRKSSKIKAVNFPFHKIFFGYYFIFISCNRKIINDEKPKIIHFNQFFLNLGLIIKLETSRN